jgi:hypothetical protein
VPAMPRVIRGRSCWTNEYLVGHCENYRVDVETGEHAGVVDTVLWAEDGFEPEALVLHAPGHDPPKIVVPLRCVVELDAEARRLVLSTDALADGNSNGHGSALREPAGAA